MNDEEKEINSGSTEAQKSLSVITVLSINILFLILWAIIVMTAYPSFQNNRGSEPFSEILVLFPYFFLLLAAYVLCFVFLSGRFSMGKWCLYGFVLVGAIILWYTPYALSGFVKQADTVWHMGMAANAPAILAGESMPFSSYVTSFPLSYLFGYMIIQVSGLPIVTVSNYVLPFLFTSMISFLIYVILSSFSDYKTGALATVACMPFMYYISLHFSPQVVGTVLVFAGILCLRNRKEGLAIILALLILPITHILSFAALLMIIIIHFFVLYRKRLLGGMDIAGTSKKNIWVITFFIVAAIILVLFTTLIVYGNIFFSRFSLDIIFPFLIDNLAFTPWFKQLVSVIYLSLFALFIYILARKFIDSKGRLNNLKKSIKNASYNTLFLTISSIASLGFGIMIAVAVHSPVLIERGLLYFIPFASLFIATNIGSKVDKKIGDRKNVFMLIKNGSVIILVLLFLAYPLGSYSIDAYNSFPASEEQGIVFIATRAYIDNISIHMYAPGQIDAYIMPDTKVAMTLHKGEIYDYSIYRRSADFKVILHNPDGESTYKNTYEDFDTNLTYMKIYCNPTFYIYHHVEA